MTADYKVSKDVVEAAYQASLSWLKLLDKEKYGDSWEKSSSLMKTAIQKEAWTHVLEQTHKPFGHLISRDIMDKRAAKNPKGLPPGEYMVMVYKSSFAHKASTLELVTLYLEKGHWNIVTYQAN